MASPQPQDAEEEAALVRRLVRGEAGALDLAYDLHKQSVYRFIRRMVRRADLVDDLFQETWLRLARGAGRLRPDTRLRAWLLTVAINLVRDRARGERGEEARLVGAPVGDPPATPFELAAAGQTERRLEDALAALPDAQREAVLLCAVERLEPAEAAWVAGVSAAAFRQRLARGRALLRAALDSSAPSPRAAREGGRR